MPGSKDTSGSLRESEPLLPAPVTFSSTSTSTSTSTPRSKLQARRYTPTSPLNVVDKGKGKGKQRADSDDDMENDQSLSDERQTNKRTTRGTDGGRGRGRCVTIIFSNESEATGGNLEVWIEEGESVGSVKEKIRHLRPSLQPLNLRLIHSGRLLTDGILFLPWLRSLEERVRRQAQGVGGDVESVLKEVGLAEDDSEDEDEDGGPEAKRGEAKSKTGKRKGDKVWLHCIVGGKEERETKPSEEEPTAPRRRGFDVLLDAGLSPADVAQMRRQFYESRGEEVPEADLDDVNDEHARALEEQWIEGDMTADTATTSTEGLYNSILHGLLTGFLLPLTPWFFFRELPLPNFFDADAEAREVLSASHATTSTVRSGNGRGSGVEPSGDPNPPATRNAINASASAGSIAARAGLGVGDEAISSVVFGQRMQMGIVLGTLINIGFGALRFLN